MNAEELIRRLDCRPGYRIASYGDVGLPLYEVTVTALCAHRGTPSAIQEFCLRLAAEGVRAPADIGGILGLSDEVCNVALAELLRGDEIKLVREPGTQGEVELTARGKETLVRGWAERPVEQTVPLRFDGWLRRVVHVPARLTCDTREAKIRGLTTLRAFPPLHPSLEELRPADANDAIEKLADSRGRARRILRIMGITKVKRLHVPTIAVAYKSVTDDSVQVGFVIDGRESEEHANAFAKVEGINKLREFRGLLGPAEKLGAEHVVGAPGRILDEVVAQEAVGQATAEKLPLTEVIHVYDHAPLLRNALEQATSLLVVISPWIKRRVVDGEFVERLRAAVARGVRVYVGYGLGPMEKDAQDEDAIKALEDLAREQSGVAIKRLGDTHAKVLIKDEEFYVITSFNWLSFQGDPDRRFREEWGSLVRAPEAVRDFWRMLQRRFEGEGDG